MELPSELEPPAAPNLWGIPEQPGLESAVNSMKSNIADIASNCRKFSASVMLKEAAQKEFLEEKAAIRASIQSGGMPGFHSCVWQDWSSLAVSAAGLALRNYRFALEPVQNLVRTIPGVLALVDEKAIKKAKAKFETAFPDVARVRHAIAHPEWYSDPKKVMSATLSEEGNPGTGPSVTFRAMSAGDDVLFTIDGEVTGFRFSRDAAALLVEITKEVFTGLSGLK